MSEATDHLSILLAAVSTRDVAAFRELYVASLPKLRAQARRWMGSADPAEDVLQLT